MANLIDREKCLARACGWCACSTNEMAIVVKNKELHEKCKEKCAIAKALYSVPVVDSGSGAVYCSKLDFIFRPEWYCGDGERNEGEQNDTRRTD